MGANVKVSIKDLSVYGLRQRVERCLQPDGKTHLGDLFITKIGLIWCKGKTGRNMA